MAPPKKQKILHDIPNDEGCIPMTPKNMKVVELRDALIAKGLSPKGLKKDLIERLEESLGPSKLSEKVSCSGEESTLEESQEVVENSDEEMVDGKNPTVADIPIVETNGPQPLEGRDQIERSEENISPSPPPETNHIIHIKNFVRPFTLSGVKELVSQFGGISDFWMDNLKSQCFVNFKDSAAAENCVKRLSGLKWPIETGKCLEADHSNEAAMIKVKNLEGSKANGTLKETEENPLDRLFMKTVALPPLYYKTRIPLPQES